MKPKVISLVILTNQPQFLTVSSINLRHKEPSKTTRPRTNTRMAPFFELRDLSLLRLFLDSTRGRLFTASVMVRSKSSSSQRKTILTKSGIRNFHYQYFLLVRAQSTNSFHHPRFLLLHHNNNNKPHQSRG
jgi:hypothetical protein